MSRGFVLKKAFVMLAVLVLGSGCSTTTEVEVTQKLDDSADAPYRKILVVALFDSHDARRYLETEIVNALAKEGATGVASTTMMDSRTPIVRQTFIDMIDEIGADALLLTQLTALKVDMQKQDASPQATYNYWPTYYWNVWGVELTEYVEPPRVLMDHSLVLVTQAFSVAARKPVWALESKSEFVELQEEGLDYNVFVDEANAIVGHLKRDGVIDK